MTLASYKKFKLVAISSNRNSFGLNGFIFMARDGEAWQAGKAKEYAHLKTGDVVAVPLSLGIPNFSALGFEIPERLDDAPAAVIEEVWKKSNAAETRDER